MSNSNFLLKVSPIVSTKWLSNSIGNSKLVIIDIRESEEYTQGHIPNSINIPFSCWITTRHNLQLELPEFRDLFNIIGKAGIKSDSVVVIINKTGHPYFLADTARVAVTLIYAGISTICILDGGYNKWVNESRDISRDIVMLNPVPYKGKINKNIFVSKDYIHSKIGKSVIVDTRTPEDYFGIGVKSNIKTVEYGSRLGHIPSAICLPGQWIWNEDGTYRQSKVLREIAQSIVGRNKDREIIIYCGVGGNTAAWWYILNQVLGYTNVKFYDGSAQEWTQDPSAPLVKYIWE